MTKPNREAHVTASIPLSTGDNPPEHSTPEVGDEQDFFDWAAVDHARKVAAIVTDYHQQFVPALAMGLTAARNLEIPPQQIAEQVGKVFGHILAALAGSVDPVELGIEHSDETIIRVQMVASTPPGGLRR